MNTNNTSAIVALIILALIFIFGKNFIKYRQSRKYLSNQDMQDLKDRCRQEQERLQWVLADPAYADKIPHEAQSLAFTDLSKLTEMEIRYLIRKIAIILAKSEAKDVKHPDVQSRSEVLAKNIEKLKAGNAATSRAGRAVAHAAKYRGTVTLDPALRDKF